MAKSMNAFDVLFCTVGFISGKFMTNAIRFVSVLIVFRKTGLIRASAELFNTRTPMALFYNGVVSVPIRIRIRNLKSQ